VLLHEISHHVHRAVRPEHREKEDVADVWKVRLQRNYNQQRFRWLGLVSRIIRPLFGSYLQLKEKSWNWKCSTEVRLPERNIWRVSKERERGGFDVF